MHPSRPSHHPLLGPETAVLAAQGGRGGGLGGSLGTALPAANPGAPTAGVGAYHGRQGGNAGAPALVAPACGAMPFSVEPVAKAAGGMCMDGCVAEDGSGKAPNQHTSYPYVTGTSVLAIKYAGGVMIAADTLGAYGATKRYKSVSRIVKAAPTTLVGAGGEISDFQHIQKLLGELNDEDAIRDDGITLKPREVFCYLQRVLYNRRNKFDPLWNSMVIAGVDQATGESFLGTTSMIGVAYSDSHVATGFGNHLARPLFRNEQRDDMSESEARALLEKALKVCYYRDKNSINKFLIGTVTKEGTTLSAPFSLATEWGYGAFVHPTRHAIGSW